MTSSETPAYFGPYRLVRGLEPSSFARRWLALHVRQQSSHVVHRFAPCSDRAERRRYLAAFEALSRIEHPHILPVEQMSFGYEARAWVVTPYTGNADGLVPLDRLLELKGGRMGPFETERAIAQLLDASRTAHEAGVIHGRLRDAEVLVDRHGSLAIEHYAVARSVLGSNVADPDAIADEVRSIAELGYECLTGIAFDEPVIPPTRVDRRLDRGWDQWFETALEASGGFATADEAIDALPSSRRESSAPASNPGRVRVVLRRFRTASPRSASENE